MILVLVQMLVHRRQHLAVRMPEQLGDGQVIVPFHQLPRREPVPDRVGEVLRPAPVLEPVEPAVDPAGGPRVPEPAKLRLRLT
jgi:hypothetical protein